MKSWGNISPRLQASAFVTISGRIPCSAQSVHYVSRLFHHGGLIALNPREHKGELAQSGSFCRSRPQEIAVRLRWYEAASRTTESMTIAPVRKEPWLKQQGVARVARGFCQQTTSWSR